MINHGTLQKHFPITCSWLSSINQDSANQAFVISQNDSKLLAAGKHIGNAAKKILLKTALAVACIAAPILACIDFPLSLAISRFKNRTSLYPKQKDCVRLMES